MAKKSDFLELGFAALESARDLDKQGKEREALPLYEEGVGCFDKAAGTASAANRALLEEEVQKWRARIAQIRSGAAAAPSPSAWEELPEAPHGVPQGGAKASASPPPEPGQGQSYGQGRTLSSEALEALEAPAALLLRQAEELHGKGYEHGAVEAYKEGIAAYMGLCKAQGSRLPAELLQTWQRKALDALTKAEHIKEGLDVYSAPAAPAAVPPTAAPAAPARPKARPRSTKSDLTSDEIAVLRDSSRVNGLIFMPWLEEDGRLEKFHFAGGGKWEDPDGLLALGESQKKKFAAFKRPSEMLEASGDASRASLAMIKNITPYSITQDMIGDCSFVASLCITSAYEQRHKRPLITNIIFPQDKRGVPVYNPDGKYMVKLWINGVVRKVVVDDRLPVGNKGQLLCSKSNDPSELWVSIIEKAYMKVNGGYDFPGSNSGIDLFALTGWLPEKIMFEEHRKRNGSSSSGSGRGGARDGKSLPLDNYQPASRVWERLLSAHKFGDCLITVSTDRLEEEEADRLGLVPSHAYAVLDVREALGIRFLQVKNPWARKRWRGHYSVEDVGQGGRWTEALKKAFAYDVHAARLEDNGVFWIDFPSVLRYFSNVFMNWNPSLFAYRTVLHALWPVTQGPKSDRYTVGSNPQYSLVVTYPPQTPAGQGGKASTVTVWMLLSRHVTRVERDDDDDEGGDFLTLLVYDGEQAGRRVYYPGKPMYQGAFTNNPHTLVRFELPPQGQDPEGECKDAAGSPPSRRYTLVVSQYEKLRDLRYTLNVSCTALFKLAPLPPAGNRQQAIAGSWDSSTAGGGLGRAGFRLNPQWSVTLSRTQRLHIQLQAPKDYSVNFMLLRTEGGEALRVDSVDREQEVVGSGAYREGFCCAEGTVEPGTYVIVVSTFRAGQEGNFLLTISHTETASEGPAPPVVRRLLPEGAGMVEQTVQGRWDHLSGSAAGCSNHGRYLDNPKFELRPGGGAQQRPTRVLLRLLVPEGAGPFPEGRPAMNVAVYPVDERGQLNPRAKPSKDSSLASPPPAASTSCGGVYMDSVCGTATPLFELHFEPGRRYVAVVSTFAPVEAPFTLLCFSDPPLSGLAPF